MRKWLPVMVVGTFLIVACSPQSVSPSPHGSDAASSPAATGPAGPSGPPPTPDLSGDLPAGIQFGPTQALPSGFSGVHADLGGELMFFGTTPSGPALATFDGSTWTTSALPPVTPYAAPGGFAVSADPRAFGPRDAVGGPRGVVVAGAAVANNVSLAGVNATAQVSIVWYSRDGQHWAWSDPRDAIGDRDVELYLADLAATEQGFLAVGTVGPVDESEPLMAVVLASPDGATWTVNKQFSGDWPLAAWDIYPGDARLLVAGREYACFAGLGSAFGRRPGAVRLWVSDDQGESWAEVDSTGATPVLDTPKPPPDQAADCPPISDFEAQDQFDTAGSVVGLAGDRVVALSADHGQTTSSSADLAEWTIADLPDAIATAGVRGGEPRVAATLLSDETVGWVLREMQPSRDATGAQVGTDCQIFWWASTDAGATWYAGPLARPVPVCTGGFYALEPLSDGSVIYTMGAAPVTPNPISAYALSTAGPLEP